MPLGADITGAVLVGDLSGTGANPDLNESGQATLVNNLTASPGAGESANNGAPVWFYWQQHILNHPVDVFGTTFKDRRLVEVRMRFGVRFRPFLTGGLTNIPTVITIYKATVFPLTDYSDLQLVATGTRYAYWEDQGQAEFDANQFTYDGLGRVGDGGHPDPGWPGGVYDVSTINYVNSLPGKGYYYIRVDSALLAGGGIRRGNIKLWWEMADRGYGPRPCGECAPNVLADNSGCLINWPLPIHNDDLSIGQPNAGKLYPASGSAAAGLYAVTYCGGAWNYYYGWVISQVPQGASPPWATDPPYQDPGSLLYYFFFWIYANGGTKTGHFNESIQGNNISDPGLDAYSSIRGYRSAAIAQDRIGCPQVFFEHDGTTQIKFSFTDAADGNSPGPSGAPIFALSRVAPIFHALSACGTPVSGNTYDIQFTFSQDINYQFNGVSCTCLLTGGVTASNTITGQTIQPVSFSTNTKTIRITIDPSFNKAILATLQFSNAVSGVLGTLAFDLTPFVSISAEFRGGSVCAGLTHQGQIQFTVQGIPADNLTLQIDPSVIAFPSVASISPGCTPGRTFTFGAVGCSSALLTFNYTVNGSGIPAPLIWADGAISLPPDVFAP